VEHFKNGQFLNGFLRGNGEYVELFEPQNYTHPLPAKFQVTETFRARSGIDFKTYPQLKVMLHGDDPIVNYIWDLGEPAYLKPERSADPPGGYEGLTNALSKIMQYPEEAQVMGIAGKVYVELIVDKDGSLKRFKIVKGIGGGCDEEVLRVMSEYAAQYHWNPAIIHGQPVKQLILLSLLFQM
jgi:protein TonB